MEDLKKFIEDLNDGIHDSTTGSFISRHYGRALEQLLRDYEVLEDRVYELEEIAPVDRYLKFN